VIPGLITGVVTWWALATAHWSWWGIATMTMTSPEQTSFGDLKSVLATSLCIDQGSDYTVCDPYGRAFTPYVLLPARAFALVGFDLEDTTAVGIALAILYVAVIAVLGVLLAAHWRGPLLWLLPAQGLLGVTAVTAPAMLMIERGQVEVITLALTVAALPMLASSTRWVRIAGAVAAFAAVVSKYLAIGLFAPFLRRGRLHWPALAAMAASVAFLLLSWSDLQLAIGTSRAQEPATSQSQFGAMALLATAFSDPPITGIPSPAVVEQWGSVRIASLVMVALAVVIAALAVRPSAHAALDSTPAAYALFVGSTGVLALPYVLGASHDYRQVFCLPALVGALIWLSHSEGNGRWVPGIVTVAIPVSMLTGASMILTPSDSLGPKEFIWPQAALVVGDLALLITLAVGAGVWMRGWMVRHE
jgi:hypothetical protein